MKSGDITVRECIFYHLVRHHRLFLTKQLWQARHEDHQHADERNFDVEHGGKPAVELIIGKIDVQNIKKQIKINHTLSTGNTVPDKKRTSTQQWIPEFKEYPHAAIQQKDNARRQLISTLVYQKQHHPNKDALLAR